MVVGETVVRLVADHRVDDPARCGRAGADDGGRNRDCRARRGRFVQSRGRADTARGDARPALGRSRPPRGRRGVATPIEVAFPPGPRQSVTGPDAITSLGITSQATGREW